MPRHSKIGNQGITEGVQTKQVGVVHVHHQPKERCPHYANIAVLVDVPKHNADDEPIRNPGMIAQR